MSVPKVDPELFVSRLDLLYKSWEVKKLLAEAFEIKELD